MPRTNPNNVETLVTQAASAVAAKWDAERKVDAGHIAEHVRASEDAIHRLEALEAMVRDLILFEKQRLSSLQAHLEDINTVEPALVPVDAPQQFKQIMGGKQ